MTDRYDLNSLVFIQNKCIFCGNFLEMVFDRKLEENCFEMIFNCENCKKSFQVQRTQSKVEKYFFILDTKIIPYKKYDKKL